jgi:hypothetical protein
MPGGSADGGKPVSLSDEQLTAIMSATAPLDPPDRSAFLAAIAAELRQHPAELGDGDIHRAIAAIQKRYFRPPDLARRAGAGKWQ